ncbi:gamma-tubulin ring complex protein [Neolentinus lepideus HHB14362 ss-1]|uniref:Spindle pole body component n=1 Tax=Neolentinus lepideus HHB14362 ss-1 TaxID=1314782 RepID=A0A165WA03_9AGAM|nr:gamma-tubulin ring complex protein [Neolentinus lepideus HHB14362 ss-1]
MIAEVLLVLAGHSSSLFSSEHTVHPAFAPLLHPGEQQCLESLGLIALRYRKIREACDALSLSSSQYICALSATLKQILRDEYESLVIETEAKVLRRDSELVARGSFVPLSAIRATFSPWEAPLTALQALMEKLQAEKIWPPGTLIDMLMARARTGVHRISEIISRLSVAVQRVWKTQLIAFLVHGSLSSKDFASDKYVLLDGVMPRCVSAQSRESIAYVGRAIGTVKAAKWEKQLPRSLAMEHTKKLERVLPEDQHAFDRVIADIRTNVSEWLWLNVLTRKDVEDAVDSLANYFLLRNGEFGLALIREIERLKISRLTARAGPSTMIREQDLHLALLRSSLGTTAQHDPSLSHLHFTMPTGPLRPLLPSLGTTSGKNISVSGQDQTTFDDLLLGTSLILTYSVTWPLDLFLQPSDLHIYAALFAYISSIRKTHTRIHACWTSLSNAQRARRRWTGLGDGGTAEDLEVRQGLLRCGWGVVREMNWFLETLLEYVMTDVVDAEFRRLKLQLGQSGPSTIKDTPGPGGPGFAPSNSNPQFGQDGLPPSLSSTASTYLDFTTLRNIHSTYLDRLLVGSLLANPELTGIVRPILEVCERFVAQVERWGGDVLPALLFEGSIGADDSTVGGMVRQRWTVVAEINDVGIIHYWNNSPVLAAEAHLLQTLHYLLESFYEQLSTSTSQQPFTATGDASKSILMNKSVANTTGFQTTFVRPKAKGGAESDGDVRRHVERLLLRLDFNGGFSAPKTGQRVGMAVNEEILKQGGLA